MKLERSTKRLTIRAYKSTDYKAWKEAYSSLPLKKKNTWDTARKEESYLTREKFKSLLAQQKKNSADEIFYNFGIFLKNGTLIGNTSLMDISRRVFQNAYLGYGIFNQYWGKGYGKEAVLAVIDIGFKELNLHRVEAGIDPQNKRSIALAKSIGLRREGLSLRRIYLREKWLDLVLFAATSEEFKINWKPKNKNLKN